MSMFVVTVLLCVNVAASVDHVGGVVSVDGVIWVGQ